MLECRASSPIHVWGQLDYQTRKADGDIEAGDNQLEAVHRAAGRRRERRQCRDPRRRWRLCQQHVHDNQFGDSVKGDGWQLGAYAVYDPGAFFLKGVTTYSSMNGDSTRHINSRAWHGRDALPATRPAARTSRCGPSASMAAPGCRWAASSVVTPYLNYDYVHAKLDGLHRDGLATAPT